MPISVLQAVQRHWIKLLGLVLTLAVIMIFARSFQANRSEPEFDQRLFVTRTLDEYPPMAYGISSFLVAGIYNKIFDSDLVTQNTHIKIGTMAFYLLAGWLLFTRYDHPQKILLAILCLLLMLTTRFPFGWLSTELIAGGFIILVLWSYLQGLPYFVTAIFLAGYAFAKPDLLFSAILVGVYMAYISRDEWRGRLINASIFGVILVLLYAPSLLEDQVASNRSILTLHQHYAVEVERHQIIGDAPDPWAETPKYIYNTWGEWESVPEAIRHNPRLYYDFLVLSVGNTVYNIGASGLILLVPAWLYCFWRVRDSRLKIITLLFLAGFIPITLLSFAHTRYLTRFYPLLLCMIYVYAAQEPAEDEASEFHVSRFTISRQWVERGMALYLAIVVVVQILWVAGVVETALWEQTTIL